MYAGDNQENMPAYSAWANCGGKVGTGLPVAIYGFNTPVDLRPLNSYTAKNVNVYACPGDIGDTRQTAGVAWGADQSCFNDWGNSYLIPWRQSNLIYPATGANGNYGWSYYAIEAIGGDNGLITGTATPAMKTSQMIPVSSKILMMDWPGAPDRPADQISAWHAVRGKPLFNILYGDNHVQAYLFTPEQRYSQTPGQGTPWGAKVDPANGYW